MQHKVDILCLITARNLEQGERRRYCRITTKKRILSPGKQIIRHSRDFESSIHHTHPSWISSLTVSLSILISLRPSSPSRKALLLLLNGILVFEVLLGVDLRVLIVVQWYFDKSTDVGKKVNKSGAFEQNSKTLTIDDNRHQYRPRMPTLREMDLVSIGRYYDRSHGRQSISGQVK